jgi:hypothetical protein
MKVSALLNEYFDRQIPRRRIFEGSSIDLPVTPKKREWERDESGSGRKYEFTQREDLKDFIQAALDYDDETGTGLKFEVFGQYVITFLAEGEGYRSGKHAMMMLDSLYEEITGR